MHHQYPRWKIIVIYIRTYPEIGNAQLGIVGLAAEQQVLGLEVSMDDALVVQVFDSAGDGPDELSRITVGSHMMK